MSYGLYIVPPKRSVSPCIPCILAANQGAHSLTVIAIQIAIPQSFGDGRAGAHDIKLRIMIGSRWGRVYEELFFQVQYRRGGSIEKLNQ